MGDILITVGALLAFLVFILAMIGGVMFLGSLLGGLGNWLLGPSRQRNEARQVEFAAEMDALNQQLKQARALQARMHPSSPLAVLSQHERDIANRSA